jgi:hypothetical protein
MEKEGEEPLHIEDGIAAVKIAGGEILTRGMS